jgi:hypothetical protein
MSGSTESLVLDDLFGPLFIMSSCAAAPLFA